MLVSHSTEQQPQFSFYFKIYKDYSQSQESSLQATVHCGRTPCHPHSPVQVPVCYTPPLSHIPVTCWLPAREETLLASVLGLPVKLTPVIADLFISYHPLSTGF